MSVQYSFLQVNITYRNNTIQTSTITWQLIIEFRIAYKQV